MSNNTMWTCSLGRKGGGGGGGGGSCPHPHETKSFLLQYLHLTQAQNYTITFLLGMYIGNAYLAIVLTSAPIKNLRLGTT